MPLISSCEPVSRILFPNPGNQERSGYHLSGCYITATILLPTLPDFPNARKYKRAAYFTGTGSDPKSRMNRDIHGIAAHKVYPSRQLLTGIVSSYLTFSPLSCSKKQDGNFLWHYLPVVDTGPAVNRCVALCCPDFPPPVSRER